MTSREPVVDAFWDAAASLLERPGVTRSTMMGFPCLRLQGDFFASWDPHNDALVIKLDQSSVKALIDAGSGEAFAPNGRTFREWMSVPAALVATWPDQLDAAFEAAVDRSQR